MVFASNLMITTQSQIYKKLPKVPHIGVEISIFQLQKVFENNLMHNWALVAQLFIQLYFKLLLLLLQCTSFAAWSFSAS